MKNKSFTLIELLVVIAIIGLLTSIILVWVWGVQGKARITKALQFSQTVQHTLGAYAVGWWSFETIEPESRVLDGSGHGNDGTVYGASITPGLKQLGSALSFDGVNDYVEVANDNSLAFGTGDMSVEFWVKTSTTPQDGWNIYHRGQGDDIGWAIMVKNGGRIQFIAGDGTNIAYVTTIATVNDGAWHHIVGVRDSNTIRAYIDGAEKATADASAVGSITPTVSLLMGKRVSERFRGVMDEVRIYSRALSVAQIQKHYAEGLEEHKNLAVR